MTDITQAQLNEVVAYYVNANDKPTARNYIETWGPKIPGYNVVAGLQQLTNAKPTPSVNSESTVTPENKPATPQNDSKSVEESKPAQATTAPAGVTTPSNTDENTNKEE
jgi:hypothetical protein